MNKIAKFFIILALIGTFFVAFLSTGVFIEITKETRIYESRN